MIMNGDGSSVIINKVSPSINLISKHRKSGFVDVKIESRIPGAKRPNCGPYFLVAILPDKEIGCSR
jgi:hypothetical protein